MLTTKQILRLLDLLKLETVTEFGGNEGSPQPYVIMRRSFGGYSDDPETGQLQAALSIMLEMAGRAGR
jgi:hypothetical protein